MAALVGIAPHLRTVAAPHISLKLMDRRRLWAPHNVQRDCLMGIAAETPDLEISVARVKSIAQCWRGLGRALVTEHPIVPSFAGEFVRFFASFLRTLRRMPDRTAVDAFAGLSAHLTHQSPMDGGKFEARTMNRHIASVCSALH